MRKNLTLLVVIISVVTIIAGLIQIFKPAFVLGFVGAEVTDTTSHFFALIGMFMALFGGLMLHTVYSAKTSRVIIFWCSLQKLGASAAVFMGIGNHIFSWLAGGVALFDLLSGFLFLVYMVTVKNKLPQESK